MIDSEMFRTIYQLKMIMRFYETLNLNVGYDRPFRTKFHSVNVYHKSGTSMFQSFIEFSEILDLPHFGIVCDSPRSFAG